MIFGVGGVVNRALGFLLLPLYLQEIREREYGALGLMMIVLSLFNVVLPLGLGNALMRSYYDYPEEERPRITTTALIFLVTLCLICLVPMYFLSPQWAQLVLHDAKFEPHFRKIFIIAFFQIIKLVPDAVLRLKMRSVRYTVMETVAFLTQLCAIIFFVVFRHEGVYGIVKGTLVGAVVETVGLYALIVGDLTWGFDRRELRRMLAFGSPLIFGRLSAMCLQSIDRFFLQHYALSPREGQREVGLYTMANNVSGAVTFLVTTPFGAVWPAMQVSVMKDHDAREYYARILTYVLFLTTFLALGAASVTLDIFRFFGKYTEAAPAVPLLCMASVLDAASQVLSVGVSLKRKTFVNPLIYAGAATVNIGLNFLLIPRYGMMGASWATVIGFFVLCVLRYTVSNAYVHIPYEWSRLARMALVSGVLYAMTRWISTGRTVFDFALHTLVALSFPLCLAVIGFYDTRERKKLAEFWKRFQSIFSESHFEEHDENQEKKRLRGFFLRVFRVLRR